ncbi:MAG: CAP domain-containing protein [Deltaproteobacteria bacterium]|nr:MAG: CAP domain-containing protein [Deltaproteobacteria bacterium]
MTLPSRAREAAGLILGFWLALTIMGPLGNPRADAVQTPSDTARYAPLEARMHAAINGSRRKHHLVELRRESLLDAIARAHSEDMAARSYLSHDTPEGLSPVDRLERGGADGFTLAGENVGKTGVAEPHDEIYEAWLASPVHRHNLLAPAFNATGIGVARALNGTYYYSQVFVTYPR